MAKKKKSLFTNPGEREEARQDSALEQVAEEFISKEGGKSLGDVDTPAFIRRVCNVELLAQRCDNRIFLC